MRTNLKRAGGLSVVLMAGVWAAGLGAALTGCAQPGKTRESTPAAERGGDPGVESLASMMEGSFSSQAQSQADPSYFDIRLHMKRIWTDRADGPWLYVEQARSDALDKPYRQRVYHLSRVGGQSYRSDVYTLPEPVARFTGAWMASGSGVRAVDPFATLDPSDLRMLEGCGVLLHWDPAQGGFTGGTEGNGCASTREGAKYTTSQITLREGLLKSWDRGFDAAGVQVWGAVKGGYEFVKQAP